MKVVIVVLLVLAACAVMRLIWHTAAFHRRVARFRSLDDGTARRQLNDILQKAGIRRKVKLLSSATCSEPLAFGLLRWRIVLPAGIEQALSAEELRALLAHEVAHLVRGDIFWLWTGGVLCTGLAFQPLNFIARRRWRQAAEFQCDDWAVEQSVNPLSLARCLARVAGWRLENTTSSTTAMAAGGTTSNLSDRIERLVGCRDENDPWQSRRRRLATVASAGVVILLLTLWGPRPALLGQPEPRSAGETQLPHGDRHQNLALQVDVPLREQTGDGQHSNENIVEKATEESAEESSSARLAHELSQLESELESLTAEVHELERHVSESSPSGRLGRLSVQLRLNVDKMQQRRERLRQLHRRLHPHSQALIRKNENPSRSKDSFSIEPHDARPAVSAATVQ